MGGLNADGNNDSAAQQSSPGLKRSLSQWGLTLYGLGAILGAGIYVLIGEIAGLAGYASPLAFLLAAVIAAFSAYSYTQLAARYPRSAGEAVYIDLAFRLRPLTTLVGFLVVFTGVVSAATMTRGIVGYIQALVDWPAPLIIIIFAAFIGLVALWGIKLSATVVAIVTLLEVGGLLYVVFVARGHIEQFPINELIDFNQGSHFTVNGLLLAGFLALYAFVGFEDMVNVAEEVKEPAKNMPRAIWSALIIATLFYMLVTVAALAVLPPQQLGVSEAPLADVVRATGQPAAWISLISLLAVVNGAIVQLIMAARVLYGMAASTWLPRALASVNPRTHTPIPATLLSTLLVLVLALAFPLAALAEATSFIILLVFALVNAALFALQYQSIVTSSLLGYFAAAIGLLLCLSAIVVKLFELIS